MASLASRRVQSVCLILAALLGMVAFDLAMANPCVDSSYQFGDPVPIGIAYWPGGLEVNWTGLHPCRPGDREKLVRRGTPWHPPWSHWRASRTDPNAASRVFS